MEFFYFLLKFLNLNSNPIAMYYSFWFTNDGALIGVLTSIIISLIFTLIFYYLVPKIKSLNSGLWLITNLISAVVVLFTTHAIAKKQLYNYVLLNGLDSTSGMPLSYTISQGTIDVWMYAMSTMIWAILFFFVFSLIIKNFSMYNKIPF